MRRVKGRPSSSSSGYTRCTCGCSKGGLPLRRPGRTRGKHMVNPLVIRALVDCLVERQEVPNREQAFHYLADKGLASYYTVRSFYYRGRQDSRFQPVYFEFPERSVRVPASIAEPFLARVRMLEAGSLWPRSPQAPVGNGVAKKS